MEWTIRMHWTEREDYEGAIIQERNEEYTIPFECHQEIYYAHKKKWWKMKSPWVVTKTYIAGVWATYTYGVALSNGEQVHEGNFDRLFKSRNEAIDFCLKNNERNKVKIYGE